MSDFFRDFWCVDVFCRVQSCSYSWARPIETELCCFAAGQLSWTISVVTALWSQVVANVYHKGIILWYISNDQLVFCFLKHFTLAFSLMWIRWLLHEALPSAFFWRYLQGALGLSNTLVIFSPFAHLAPCCPLSVTVRGPHQCMAWQARKELSSCCLALCQYRQVVRVWRCMRWLVPALCRSKPINLQCHSAYCCLIALFPLNITMETMFLKKFF